MPGRNGTWLSGFAIFFAVGDFLEFVAGFGHKLVCLGLRFLAPGFCHSSRGENAVHE
jgi:hypothetical protein